MDDVVEEVWVVPPDDNSEYLRFVNTALNVVNNCYEGYEKF